MHNFVNSNKIFLVSFLVEQYSVNIYVSEVKYSPLLEEMLKC